MDVESRQRLIKRELVDSQRRRLVYADELARAQQREGISRLDLAMLQRREIPVRRCLTDSELIDEITGHKSALVEALKH